MTKKEYLCYRHETIFKPAYDALMKVYPFNLDDLDGELWKEFLGYQISNFGRIKSFHKGKVKILKPKIGRDYLQIALSKNAKRKNFYIHRLVAKLFIANPDSKSEVNHKDGNKFNNHVSNLEWCTQSENQRHAVDTGLKVAPQGEDRHDSKLTNEQARFVRDNPFGLTGRQLAALFSVCPTTISDIQRGQKYKIAGGSVRQARKRIVLPDNIRAQIRAEYQKGVVGHGAPALAKKHGVSQSTIQHIVKEFSC